MDGKKKTVNTYFGKKQLLIEDLCKGKTKDEQIKFLKHEFADSMTLTKMCLDGWDKTLSAWKFYNKLNLISLIIAFLLGIAWGIVLFA